MLEAQRGYLTGRTVGNVCFGAGKLAAMTHLLARKGERIEDAFFYTDSYSDRPGLAAVGYPRVVCPDRKLRRFALRAGWPILEWGQEEENSRCVLSLSARIKGAPVTDTVSTIDLKSILETPAESAPTRRIYANQNMAMADIELIGFDMDYTIAAYHQRPMDELAIEATIQKLVSKCGYPETIREAKLDLDFIIRGSSSIKRQATSLKWMRTVMWGAVITVIEHSVRMSVKRLMGRGPSGWPRTGTAWVDTLFSLAEATLLAGLIEHYKKLGEVLPWSYRQLFDDIRKCIDEAHADDTLKTQILKDLPKYIIKDPDLAPTLHRLRSAGKTLPTDQ